MIALLDTAVFVYARGREHPLREPCRSLVAAIRDGRLRAEISVEAVQEYCHILRRRQIPAEEVADAGHDLMAMCHLRAFDTDVLDLALNLLARHSALQMRDAVHAATAQHGGLDFLISPDEGFGDLEGLTHLTPQQASERVADPG